MSKLTIYLLSLVVGVLFIAGLDFESLVQINLFKIILGLLILMIGIYLIMGLFKESKKISKKTYFAQKITPQEFERQRKIFTQIKNFIII